MTPATRMGLTIALATGLYGVSFGALSVASGLSVLETAMLGLLMFTGGSQFAFVGVVGGGGSGAAATTAASLLGLRNGVYGVALAPVVRPTAWLRPFAALLTIDESMAVATAQLTPEEQRRGFWVTGLGVYLAWNAMVLVGALAGDALGDGSAYGLDGMAVAAFLALLWPRLKGRDAWALAVVCGLATVLVTPTLPPGLPILVAALVALPWGLRR